MKLKICGGVGEHGRNCFEIITDQMSFLVDCGKGKDDMPDLKKKEIRKLSYVFLTHSHGDHTGALDWLIDKGFEGTIYGSEETVRQWKHTYEKVISLETECPSFVRWQRAGHCAGAVSYIFTIGGKKIVFTGDYCEESSIYVCDPLRNEDADLAVVDCAYGDHIFNREENLKKISDAVSPGKRILFPVPKYGRGLDLIDYLSRKKVEIYADDLLLSQIENMDSKWYRKKIEAEIHPFDEVPEQGLLFVTDPQVRKDKTRKRADKCDQIILTGHVYPDTYSDRLLKKGNAVLIPYPVHMNRKQAEALIKKNHFRKTILYHSEEIRAEENPIEF